MPNREQTGSGHPKEKPKLCPEPVPGYPIVFGVKEKSEDYEGERIEHGFLPLPILPVPEQLGLSVERAPHFVPVRNGCCNKKLPDRSIDLLRVVRGPDSHKNSVSIGFVGRWAMLRNYVVIGGFSDKRVHPGGHTLVGLLLRCGASGKRHEDCNRDENGYRLHGKLSYREEFID